MEQVESQMILGQDERMRSASHRASSVSDCETIKARRRIAISMLLTIEISGQKYQQKPRLTGVEQPEILGSAWCYALLS
jgi:hypothetical protein